MYTKICRYKFILLFSSLRDYKKQFLAISCGSVCSYFMFSVTDFFPARTSVSGKNQTRELTAFVADKMQNGKCLWC